jgi:GTP-binding protein
MGQPNVGKSTMTNKILGEKRMLVEDKPGITRDSVMIPFRFGNRDLILADTPGLRRKSRVKDDIETLSALKALTLLKEVDIIILVIDATVGIENYDFSIASRVVDEGKILAIALNKWDKVPEDLRDDLLLKLKHEFYNSFNQIVKPLILPVSAEKGTGINNLLKRALELWDKANTRVPTSLINRVVEKLVKQTPPPLSRLKRPMKIKFAAQTGADPIVITLFVNDAVDLPESYERFLRNKISEQLGWENLVVKIAYKASSNPYDNKED